MLRIVIVEDHLLVREGLKALLEREPDIEVVGEASDGYEAIRLVEQLKPDVAIIDISLPKLNGNQAIQRIKKLEVQSRIIVLSMYSDPVLIRTAFQNGAKAYILKQSILKELLFAIKAAMNNQNFISSSLSNVFLEDFLRRNESSESMGNLLTSRETDVLKLIASGYGNTTIAQQLNISVKTVETHRSNIMDKLKIYQTAGLVKYALKHELVSME